jgi:hypothetical protein
MGDPHDGLPPLPPGGNGVNPYAAPTAVGGTAGATTGDGTGGPGLVRHVMPVAILMIVQGSLELLMALIFLGLTFAVPFMFPDGGAAAELRAGPPPGMIRTIMMAVYGVMGAGGLVGGVLHVTAGVFGLRFRRRVLGVVALTVGIASITTVYCAPTAIGLAIYGLITYLNPAVVAAFGLGDAGVPAADVRARFGC